MALTLGTGMCITMASMPMLSRLLPTVCGGIGALTLLVPVGAGVGTLLTSPAVTIPDGVAGMAVATGAVAGDIIIITIPDGVVVVAITGQAGIHIRTVVPVEEPTMDRAIVAMVQPRPALQVRQPVRRVPLLITEMEVVLQDVSSAHVR